VSLVRPGRPPTSIGLAVNVAVKTKGAISVILYESGSLESSLVQMSNVPGRAKRSTTRNERRADQERGRRQASREDDRCPVPHGQGSLIGQMVSRHARGHVHEGGDAESGADLAGRVDQPTYEPLLEFSDAPAACHGRRESGAAGPEPYSEQSRVREDVVTRSDYRG
jgi:hypothetical protein